MSADIWRRWLPVILVSLAGSLATALVPLTVPILKPLAAEFHIPDSSLGWIVSFPTLVCALGALATGVIVDRLGDVRLLLVGVAMVILGDIGVCIAPAAYWLFAARIFQGVGYVSLTVAGPSFIQRTTTGEMRRAAMAFWAAHTPLGFAGAVFIGAQFVAHGMSWRFSFVGHAAAAVVLGLALRSLRSAPSETDFSRSVGTREVLTDYRPYAVGLGALAAGMMQVSVMTLLPSLLGRHFGLSGSQAALVVVLAMVANWIGSMLIVTTGLKAMPRVALPASALLTAVFAFAAVSGLFRDVTTTIACALVFAAAVGAANSLVWSHIPAATPSARAVGATAGLVTQGSFIGVLFGPPIFFSLQHQGYGPLAAISLLLGLLMLPPIIVKRRGRDPVEPKGSLSAEPS